VTIVTVRARMMAWSERIRLKRWEIR